MKYIWLLLGGLVLINANYMFPFGPAALVIGLFAMLWFGLKDSVFPRKPGTVESSPWFVFLASFMIVAGIFAGWYSYSDDEDTCVAVSEMVWARDHFKGDLDLGPGKRQSALERELEPFVAECKSLGLIKQPSPRVFENYSFTYSDLAMAATWFLLMIGAAVMLAASVRKTIKARKYFHAFIGITLVLLVVFQMFFIANFFSIQSLL
ncbi:MAG: hypothetical protein WCJ29_05370 [bacterium]